ncbi:Periplasmic serine endoprotease DegP [Buchnera aphidicola (Tetraneura ulmi)]|uniref:Do family serine endopeptidase n=1 Tax=Buchnera aphidicola TaxID=9 RepID=UPI0034642AF2
MNKNLFFLCCFFFCFFFIQDVNSSIVFKNNKKSELIIPTLSHVLDKVMPSVVSISVEGFYHRDQENINNNHSSNNYSDFFKNSNLNFKKESLFSFQKKDFNSKENKNFKSNSSGVFYASGSGVIIDAKNAYVVTNSHVINHARKIEVELNDHRSYAAKLVGKDVSSDIAVLKLQNVKNLKSIKLSNSDLLKVGDYTLAIGNPYGLGNTVTLGIVSALGRSGLHLEYYENFIQTDAAINRGNSGGALVNLRGELIGINTAILAPGGGNIGIGFSIPSNMITNASKQIVKYGYVKRGKLGIIGTDLNSELAKIMKINLSKGVFVNQVLPHSVADKSGIKPGEILVTINGKIISNFSSFRAVIGSNPIENPISLGVFDGKKIKNIILKLQYIKSKKHIFPVRYKILKGVSFSYYHFKKIKFVKIKSIRKKTPACFSGFKVNDVILKINNDCIHSLLDLKKALNKNSSTLVFRVFRSGRIVYLTLK